MVFWGPCGNFPQRVPRAFGLDPRVAVQSWPSRGLALPFSLLRLRFSALRGMNITTLRQKPLDELRRMARRLDLPGDPAEMRKQDLIYHLLEVQAERAADPEEDERERPSSKEDPLDGTGNGQAPSDVGSSPAGDSAGTTRRPGAATGTPQTPLRKRRRRRATAPIPSMPNDPTTWPTTTPARRPSAA